MTTNELISTGGDNPVGAEEVLVFDTSTFIAEIGLMSQKGSALKYYLYCRGTRLVVPQAAAEEYERNLIKQANEENRTNPKGPTLAGSVSRRCKRMGRA